MWIMGQMKTYFELDSQLESKKCLMLQVSGVRLGNNEEDTP